MSAQMKAASVRDFCTRKSVDQKAAIQELLKLDFCGGVVSELLFPQESPAAAAQPPAAAAAAAADGAPPPAAAAAAAARRAGVTNPAADAGAARPAAAAAAAAAGQSASAAAIAEARRKLLEPYAAGAARAEADALFGAPDPYIGQFDILDGDGPAAAELKRKRAIWKKVNAPPPSAAKEPKAGLRPLPARLQLKAYILTTSTDSSDLTASTFLARSRKMADDALCTDEIAYILASHRYDVDAVPLIIDDCVVLDAKRWRETLWSSDSLPDAKAMDMFEVGSATRDVYIGPLSSGTELGDALKMHRLKMQGSPEHSIPPEKPSRLQRGGTHGTQKPPGGKSEPPPRPRAKAPNNLYTKWRKEEDGDKFDNSKCQADFLEMDDETLGEWLEEHSFFDQITEAQQNRFNKALGRSVLGKRRAAEKAAAEKQSDDDEEEEEQEEEEEEEAARREAANAERAQGRASRREARERRLGASSGPARPRAPVLASVREAETEDDDVEDEDEGDSAAADALRDLQAGASSPSGPCTQMVSPLVCTLQSGHSGDCRPAMTLGSSRSGLQKRPLV